MLYLRQSAMGRTELCAGRKLFIVTASILMKMMKCHCCFALCCSWDVQGRLGIAHAISTLYSLLSSCISCRQFKRCVIE